jgi:hypothetical protein
MHQLALLIHLPHCHDQLDIEMWQLLLRDIGIL